MIENRSVWIAAIGAAVFWGVWLGIPTFNQWRADKYVNELCAKDGGMVVYEAVTLPRARFNRMGQPDIPLEPNKKSDDEYFVTYTSTNIRGNPDAGSIFDLVIFRSESTYFRQRDEKVIGRLVTYSRRGGDAFGQFHPSHYTCPSGDLPIKKLFVQQQEK